MDLFNQIYHNYLRKNELGNEGAVGIGNGIKHINKISYLGL